MKIKTILMKKKKTWDKEEDNIEKKLDKEMKDSQKKYIQIRTYIDIWLDR
jgi:hypothetical protein